MYCSYYEEDFDREHCENECERANSCSQLKKAIQEEKNLNLVGSEMYQKAKESLMSTLSLPENKVDEIVFNLCKQTLTAFEHGLKNSFKVIAQKIAQDYINLKCKKYLDDCFLKALGDEITAIDKDEKVMTTNIQKVVMEKTIKFLKNKSGYNSRRDIDKTVEEAIEKIVDSKVDEALKELKTEAIDKFNKEAMKTMMRGMAKSIGNDAKLLSILTMD